MANCRILHSGQHAEMAENGTRFTRVKDLLGQTGMTQKALAEAMGWTPQFLNRKINEKTREDDGTVDRFRLEELFKIAEILKVPAWTLVEGSQDAEIRPRERAILKLFKTLPGPTQEALLIELANEQPSAAENMKQRQ